MKNRILTIIVFSLFLFFGSCEKSTKNLKESIPVENEKVTEKIKNIEVDIEGMTCEIGCARLIQSKLYKTDGIKFAEVSFENKLGKISFDESKISLEEIITKIEKIGGGDLYKVVESREVEKFNELNKTKKI